MILKQLSTSDLVHLEGDSIRIEFTGKRNVLSTCAFNGGYKENLNTVFNYDSSHKKTVFSEMKAPTLEEHMKLTAIELGLNPDTSTGMCTAAQMENVAIKEIEYDGITVTAVVTGGIDINGGRAGDPASWHEKGGKIESINLISGTINIMLVIDAFISENVLAEALMTITEAKVAAIQELILPSRYSRGIATGSGTDKVIVIGNPSSGYQLTDAGKHSKLGEMIGRTVIFAVKEALDKQTNANPAAQHSVVTRMSRYGVTKDKIHTLLTGKSKYIKNTYTQWDRLIDEADRQSDLVIAASMYVHLLDQLQWGLLDENEVQMAGEKILKEINNMNSSHSNNIDNSDVNREQEDITEYLIRKYEEIFAEYIYSNCLGELE